MIINCSEAYCSVYSGSTLLFSNVNNSLNLDNVIHIEIGEKDILIASSVITIYGMQFNMSNGYSVQWWYNNQNNMNSDFSSLGNSLLQPIYYTFLQNSQTYQNNNLINAVIKQVYLNGVLFYPIINYTFNSKEGIITGATNFLANQNLAIFF